MNLYLYKQKVNKLHGGKEEDNKLGENRRSDIV
jgi:hypothetical protein